MKYIINYGNKVAVIPNKALEIMPRASAVDIKVLLAVCANDGKADEKKLAKLFLCGEDDIKAAISFWRGAGVIDAADATDGAELPAESAEIAQDAQGTAKPSTKKLRAPEELPRYSTEELANVLESRQDAATLIDECQNIAGKVFNVKEINVLVGLIDYLGLEPDYVMMLLTYCVAGGKKSLHYVEKTAFGLYDAGITTSDQLAEELRRREAAQEAEGKIRSLFGVGERAFTIKEKKFISSWINELGYSIEIIGKAYEVTADATGKGSFPYANSVLERWNAAGLRTLEEIEASYSKGEMPTQGSFDTDSFFDAAVKRSLGEN